MRKQKHLWEQKSIAKEINPLLIPWKVHGQCSWTTVPRTTTCTYLLVRLSGFHLLHNFSTLAENYMFQDRIKADTTTYIFVCRVFVIKPLSLFVRASEKVQLAVKYLAKDCFTTESGHMSLLSLAMDLLLLETGDQCAHKFGTEVIFSSLLYSR